MHYIELKTESIVNTFKAPIVSSIEDVTEDNINDRIDTVENTLTENLELTFDKTLTTEKRLTNLENALVNK